LKNAPLIKNLLYRNKKKKFFLILAHIDTRVERGFWRKIGNNPSNVRTCSKEQIKTSI